MAMVDDALATPGPLPPAAASPPHAIAVAPRGDVVAVQLSASEQELEKFIPVTRFALIDRLCDATVWPQGMARDVRRFFRYLDYWRQQQYNARLFELEETYEPFSPDTDLLLTRKFSDAERHHMQARVVDGMRRILQQANYRQIEPSEVNLILTAESHYGLDLHVDLGAFDELLIFYRGATSRKDQRRKLGFLRKEELDVPIYQRLFLLFKLKPFETRVGELMRSERLSRDEAEKKVRRLRALLPPQVSDENIYMKLFKNIPRTDIEMVFPNTTVRFRKFDKLKLGASAGGSLGMGAVGAAGKIALLASNPLAAAGAVAGLGGVAFRQAVNFMNQKQRYMVVMAKNLYFHSMADNRGVMLKMAARAAEEDVKEEMLLYAVLARTQANRRDLPDIDRAIESHIAKVFGVAINFDIDDALGRLIADGIVTEDADGTLHTLPPREAALHIDAMWDVFLDNLPEPISAEGFEFAGDGDSDA